MGPWDNLEIPQIGTPQRVNPWDPFAPQNLAASAGKLNFMDAGQGAPGMTPAETWDSAKMQAQLMKRLSSNPLDPKTAYQIGQVNNQLDKESIIQGTDTADVQSIDSIARHMASRGIKAPDMKKFISAMSAIQSPAQNAPKGPGQAPAATVGGGSQMDTSGMYKLFAPSLGAALMGRGK